MRISMGCIDICILPICIDKGFMGCIGGMGFMEGDMDIGDMGGIGVATGSSTRWIGRAWASAIAGGAVSSWRLVP
jgi:hypothetical protein